MDSDVSNKAADADMALQELGADHAGIAYVTAAVTVWDRDPALAAEKLRLVEKVIQGRDFTCTIEGMQTRSRHGSARSPAMSTPMSGSRPFHSQSRPPDPPVSGMGGSGTGRAFR